MPHLVVIVALVVRCRTGDPKDSYSSSLQRASVLDVIAS